MPKPDTKWIAEVDAEAFQQFCRDNGHEVRNHTDPFKRAFQVRHQGHWMGVVWNKSWNQYTADRRLGLLVQSFAASRQPTQKEGADVRKD